LGDGAFYVIDVLRGTAPPFNPDEVVNQYAELLKQYRLHSIVGDSYSAGWVSSSFARAGIKYQRSELNKSALYLEALPQFSRQAIALPNHRKLLRELRLLERRTSRLGKDVVDHPVHCYDDYANSACGLLHNLSSMVDVTMQWVSGDDSEENQDGRETYSAAGLKAYLCSVRE
jgi:hypothetical protein